MNSPTSPTKTEIMEQHWFQFLQFIKNIKNEDKIEYGAALNAIKKYGYEFAFWSWYVDYKVNEEKN